MADIFKSWRQAIYQDFLPAVHLSVKPERSLSSPSSEQFYDSVSAKWQ